MCIYMCVCLQDTPYIYMFSRHPTLRIEYHDAPFSRRASPTLFPYSMQKGSNFSQE